MKSLCGLSVALCASHCLSAYVDRSLQIAEALNNAEQANSIKVVEAGEQKLNSAESQIDSDWLTNNPFDFLGYNVHRLNDDDDDEPTAAPGPSQEIPNGKSVLSWNVPTVDGTNAATVAKGRRYEKKPKDDYDDDSWDEEVMYDKKKRPPLDKKNMIDEKDTKYNYKPKPDTKKDDVDKSYLYQPRYRKDDEYDDDASWEDAKGKSHDKYDESDDRYDNGKSGYDKYGYDKYGYDKYGYDKYGYDKYGYDKYGYDKYGYDKYDHDKSGKERYDDDKYGDDKYGDDKYGNDKYGNDKYGSDKYGRDKYGRDKYGRDKYGRDKYDSDKYDSDKYDSDKYDSDKYDSDKYDSDKYDSDKYDRDKYDRDKYDSDKYDSDKYDSRKYDSRKYDSDKYDSDKYDSDKYDSDKYDSDKYDGDKYDGDKYGRNDKYEKKKPQVKVPQKPSGKDDNTQKPSVNKPVKPKPTYSKDQLALIENRWEKMMDAFTPFIQGSLNYQNKKYKKNGRSFCPSYAEKYLTLETWNEKIDVYISNAPKLCMMHFEDGIQILKRSGDFGDVTLFGEGSLTVDARSIELTGHVTDRFRTRVWMKVVLGETFVNVDLKTRWEVLPTKVCLKKMIVTNVSNNRNCRVESLKVGSEMICEGSRKCKRYSRAICDQYLGTDEMRENWNSDPMHRLPTCHDWNDGVFR